MPPSTCATREPFPRQGTHNRRLSATIRPQNRPRGSGRQNCRLFATSPHSRSPWTSFELPPRLLCTPGREEVKRPRGAQAALGGQADARERDGRANRHAARTPTGGAGAVGTRAAATRCVQGWRRRHTRGQPQGAVGATRSLLALSACVRKRDMYEYQRSSALLDHSGAVAIKFEMGARRPCPGEAAHERLRNL